MRTSFSEAMGIALVVLVVLGALVAGAVLFVRDQGWIAAGIVVGIATTWLLLAIAIWWAGNES